MPPIPARDEPAAKYDYGIDEEVVLQLKEKAMEARGRAYCMSVHSTLFYIISSQLFAFMMDVENQREGEKKRGK